MGQSLQVSFDVIDIIAHNSVDKNKKLILDTCQIRPETVIFNSIQSSLNMVNNDEISALCDAISRDKIKFVFIICLTQALLTSRQILTCIGLKKHIPWGVSSIIQCLISLNQFDSSDLNNLPKYLIDVNLSF